MRSNIANDKDLWIADASHSAKKALKLRKRNKPFLAEELYKEVTNFYVDLPVEPRWWGNVIRNLAADKYIAKCGVSQAKTSNGSIKWLWERT